MSKRSSPTERRIIAGPNSFLCYACRKEFPNSFKDEHHEIPQAAGGQDEDILWLDQGCHQQAHRIGDAMMNPKRQSEVDLLLSSYKDANHRRRMAELAATVVEELMAKKEGKVDLSKIPGKVRIEFDRPTYNRIMKAARDSRVSIVNYIKQATLEKLRKE